MACILLHLPNIEALAEQVGTECTPPGMDALHPNLPPEVRYWEVVAVVARGHALDLLRKGPDAHIEEFEGSSDVRRRRPDRSSSTDLWHDLSRQPSCSPLLMICTACMMLLVPSGYGPRPYREAVPGAGPTTVPKLKP